MVKVFVRKYVCTAANKDSAVVAWNASCCTDVFPLQKSALHLLKLAYATAPPAMDAKVAKLHFNSSSFFYLCTCPSAG